MKRYALNTLADLLLRGSLVLLDASLAARRRAGVAASTPEQAPPAAARAQQELPFQMFGAHTRAGKA